MKSILMQRPYLTLGILTMLLIAEMVLGILDIVPITFEWLLGWVLFLTTLAWMSMAGLAGVVAPVSDARMRHVLSVLAPFPLAAFMLGLLGWSWFPLWHPGLLLLTLVWLGMAALTGAVTCAGRSAGNYLVRAVFPLLAAGWFGLFLVIAWLMEFLDIIWPVIDNSILVVPMMFWLALALMVGAVVLRTVLIERPRTLSLYIRTALTALGVSAAAVVLVPGSIFIIGGWLGILLISLWPLLAAVVMAVPGVMLIASINHPFRNVAVAAVGLWAMIIVVGWYWYAAMDDGLSAFTGEERAEARVALGSARCYHDPIGVPGKKLVFKDGNGSLVVENRTLWGLPARCQ